MEGKWEWNENLETGIDNVDEQHKTLVFMVNRLMSELAENKREKAVSETIEFLEAYIILHFNEEENLQRKVKYTHYEEHKNVHDEFVKNFQTIKSDYENYGINTDLTFRLSEMVADWLLEHISVVDKKLADFINEKR